MKIDDSVNMAGLQRCAFRAAFNGSNNQFAYLLSNRMKQEKAIDDKWTKFLLANESSSTYRMQKTRTLFATRIKLLEL